MSESQRLALVTRHFKDLQTIRFAVVPVAMVMAPAIRRIPPPGRALAWGMVLSFLICAGLFFWWSTIAIKRRYGAVQVSRGTQRAPGYPALILSVFLVLGVAWFRFFVPHVDFWDVYIPFTISIIMLTIVVDSTNPAERRIVWAAGLLILLAAGPFLIGADGGAAIFALAGGVWLALSIFDFLLLRRAFGDLAMEASPQQG